MLDIELGDELVHWEPRYSANKFAHEWQPRNQASNRHMGRHPFTTAKLTPEDFRVDLTDQEIVEIGLEQKTRLIDEEIWRTYEWGLALVSLGIDPEVMRDPDFNPADYGIAQGARPIPKIV